MPNNIPLSQLYHADAEELVSAEFLVDVPVLQAELVVEGGQGAVGRVGHLGHHLQVGRQ